MLVHFCTLPFKGFWRWNPKCKVGNVKGRIVLFLLDRLDRSVMLVFDIVDKGIAR